MDGHEVKHLFHHADPAGHKIHVSQCEHDRTADHPPTLTFVVEETVTIPVLGLEMSQMVAVAFLDTDVAEVKEMIGVLSTWVEQREQAAKAKELFDGP